MIQCHIWTAHKCNHTFGVPPALMETRLAGYRWFFGRYFPNLYEAILGERSFISNPYSLVLMMFIVLLFRQDTTKHVVFGCVRAHAFIFRMSFGKMHDRHIKWKTTQKRIGRRLKICCALCPTKHCRKIAIDSFCTVAYCVAVLQPYLICLKPLFMLPNTLTVYVSFDVYEQMSLSGPRMLRACVQNTKYERIDLSADSMSVASYIHTIYWTNESLTCFPCIFSILFTLAKLHRICEVLTFSAKRWLNFNQIQFIWAAIRKTIEFCAIARISALDGKSLKPIARSILSITADGTRTLASMSYV